MPKVVVTVETEDQVQRINYWLVEGEVEGALDFPFNVRVMEEDEDE